MVFHDGVTEVVIALGIFVANRFPLLFVLCE